MPVAEIAVHIADRFGPGRDPDAIYSRQALQNALVLVFIFHMVLIVVALRGQEVESARPRIIPDLDISFHLLPPPPEPPALIRPPEVRFIPLPPAPLPEPAAPSPPAVAPSPPTPAPSSKLSPPREAPRSPRGNEKVQPAPVSVTDTNVIKAPPLPPVREPHATVEDTATQELAIKPTEPAPNSQPASSEQDGADNAATDPHTHGADTTSTTGGVKIATTLTPAQRAGLLNIARYKRNLISRITGHWHPTRSVTGLALRIRIARDGTLLDVQVIASSGHKKTDRQAVEAVKNIEPTPLPEAYQGEFLTFDFTFTAR